MESLALENHTPAPLESQLTNNSSEEVVTRVEVSSVEIDAENQSSITKVVEISTTSSSEDNKALSPKARNGQADRKKEEEGAKEGKATPEKVSAEKKEHDAAKAKNLMIHVKAMMGMQYMRNDGVPAEVLPGFYLGSIGAALNRKILQTQNVGHILCCCDNVKEAYPDAFKYRMLELLDRPDEDITRYFDETAEYIHDLLSKGERVLVHCFAGKSRSTTIMISYLIKYHKMTVEKALQVIREKRPVAQPNMGFLKQLRAYEKKVLESVSEVQPESSA